MKHILKIILMLVIVSSCKNETTTASTVIEDIKKEDITTSIYPDAITKVFDAHGGIDKWNAMQTLSFTMNKPNGKELTITHLKTRAERIDTPTYAMGNDGNTLWVNEKNDIEYKGNARFYKGLMMYFYAMPFILGDSGIIYEETEPLTFEGTTYPGLLISYEAGVGESPDDQYLVYYDEKTGKMEWLAYTVTFGKEGKSKDFRFIHYNNWQTVNGLVLPKSIDWYKVEDGVPTEKRNTVKFEEVILSEEAPDSTLFTKPETAKIVE